MKWLERFWKWWRKAEGGPDKAKEQPQQANPEALKDPLSALREAVIAKKDGEALACFDELAAQKGVAFALREASALLVNHEIPALRMRLAAEWEAMGDEENALALLADFPEQGVDETLLIAAWSMRAEIAERRGQSEEARRFWERVLMKDIHHPRARARLLENQSQLRPGPNATIALEAELAHGRYRVQGLLGRGASGTVFDAYDQRIGRRIALKLMHRRGPEERARLLHEARVPWALSHPGVIRILDVDPDVGLIAMEPLEASLRDRLRQGLSPRELCMALAEIAKVLSWVHEAGWVHRDLKPSNLLFRAGMPVLSDFALALPKGALPQGGEGTRPFMPPEQAQGKPADPAQDIHALGVMLAQILPKTPALAPLIDSMRDPNPAHRPSASAIAHALENAASTL
ncbi:MAG: serine/threonine-protein kinase [Sandaracinaceae bacterium]|nr:serine/threonine-protein kinase [Sandaracinaceae bacterium]